MTGGKQRPTPWERGENSRKCCLSEGLERGIQRAHFSGVNYCMSCSLTSVGRVMLRGSYLCGVICLDLRRFAILNMDPTRQTDRRHCEELLFQEYLGAWYAVHCKCMGCFVRMWTMTL